MTSHYGPIGRADALRPGDTVNGTSLLHAIARTGSTVDQSDWDHATEAPWRIATITVHPTARIGGTVATFRVEGSRNHWDVPGSTPVEYRVPEGDHGTVDGPGEYHWRDFEPEPSITADESGDAELHYLTICDIAGDELAVILHHTSDGAYPLDGAAAQSRRNAAQLIVDSLNAYNAPV